MIPLLLALLCIIGNGFFVGAEFALAKVRPTALETLAKAGDSRAARALAITHVLDQYLPATQLGITLASLALGWLGEPAIAEILHPWLSSLGIGERASEGIAVTVGFTVISMLHIVVGELVPKSIAITRPEDLARYAAYPLHIFYLISYPALVVLNVCSKFTLRLMGLPAPEHAEGKLSLEELRLIIAASLSGNEVEQQRELLERVLRATDRPVRAIMVPRVDIEILSLTDDFDTWMAKVRKHGFSRYPVATDRNADHIVGYVYVKDFLFLSTKERPPVSKLKRDILIVPESRTVGAILREFQETKIPIALIVDEYGGTSGLVTLEDAVAEIVGDINDELKGAAQPRLRREPDGALVVDGALPIDDLDLDGTSLPPVENADTVGGYILASLERLASPGDRIEIGDWEAIVEDVRQRRVHRVRFRKKGSLTVPPPKDES